MELPTKGKSLSYETALDLALSLSEKGRGHVEPNPCVGAVLVDSNHNFVSGGFHRRFGGAHAEVDAFEGLAGDFKNHTLYVTLEPCSHFGKTPPCCEFIVSKGVSKLVFIDVDPNPKVSGNGIQFLKDNGVEISQAPAIYSKRNKIINRTFFHFYEKEEAYVHLKWAQTLDGKLSVKGEQTTITGLEAREHSHFLRAQREMVLVGTGTMSIDNPYLNVRYPGIEKENKVGVFDPELSLLKSLRESNVCKVHDPENVFLFSSCESSNQEFQICEVPNLANNEFDLKFFKKRLHGLGVQSVLVEGGAKTIASFLSQDVYDEVSIYIAPKFIGQRGIGISQYADEKFLADFEISSLREVQRVGDDALVNFQRS